MEGGISRLQLQAEFLSSVATKALRPAVLLVINQCSWGNPQPHAGRRPGAIVTAVHYCRCR